VRQVRRVPSRKAPIALRKLQSRLHANPFSLRGRNSPGIDLVVRVPLEIPCQTDANRLRSSLEIDAGNDRNRRTLPPTTTITKASLCHPHGTCVVLGTREFGPVSSLSLIPDTVRKRSLMRFGTLLGFFPNLSTPGGLLLAPKDGTTPVSPETLDPPIACLCMLNRSYTRNRNHS
jgi:hypothetical protein